MTMLGSVDSTALAICLVMPPLEAHTHQEKYQRHQDNQLNWAKNPLGRLVTPARAAGQARHAIQ